MAQSARIAGVVEAVEDLAIRAVQLAADIKAVRLVAAAQGVTEAAETGDINTDGLDHIEGFLVTPGDLDGALSELGGIESEIEAAIALLQFPGAKDVVC